MIYKKKQICQTKQISAKCDTILPICCFFFFSEKRWCAKSDQQINGPKTTNLNLTIDKFIELDQGSQCMLSLLCGIWWKIKDHQSMTFNRFDENELPNVNEYVAFYSLNFMYTLLHLCACMHCAIMNTRLQFPKYAHFSWWTVKANFPFRKLCKQNKSKNKTRRWWRQQFLMMHFVVGIFFGSVII